MPKCRRKVKKNQYGIIVPYCCASLKQKNGRAARSFFDYISSGMVSPIKSIATASVSRANAAI